MVPTFICLFAEVIPPVPCDLLSCFEISQAAFSPRTYLIWRTLDSIHLNLFFCYRVFVTVQIM